jgi:hypothetical protein
MNRYTKVHMAVLAVLVTTSSFAETTNVSVLELNEIEVISTTPLKGIGLPIEKIPATVQTVKAKDIAILG